MIIATNHQYIKYVNINTSVLSLVAHCCQFHRRMLCYNFQSLNIGWGGYWGGHIIKQILHTLSYSISQFIPPR